MHYLNAILNPLFDLLLSPFASIGAWPGMVLVSAMVGILILFVFKFTSNQARLKRKKNRAIARVLEFVLYRDDIVVTLGAFKRVVLSNFMYLGELLVPLLISLIPLLLVLIQLSAWFTYRPIAQGETTVLTARLPDRLPVLEQKISIKTSSGIHLDTEAVRAPSVNEISWRLKAGPGNHEWAELTVNGNPIRKAVAVGSTLCRISPSRRPACFSDQLLYPSEASLPKNAPVTAIHVQYPERDLAIRGLRLHWLFVFFVLSMLAGLVMMKPLKVTL